MAETKAPGGGSDPVSAIANAVGSGFDMVSAFVAKAAQRYGLAKSMEVGTVQFEQQKTLDMYAGVVESRKLFTYAAIALLTLIVIAKIYSKKK